MGGTKNGGSAEALNDKARYFHTWRNVPLKKKVSRRSPMKARRGGLSLGAGFRAAQSEQKSRAFAEKNNRNRQPVKPDRSASSTLDPTVDGPQVPDLTSPEKDDFDESDLDARTQTLLSKFISHHLPNKSPVKEAPEHKLSASRPNPLKRRADSISTDISADTEPNRIIGPRLTPIRSEGSNIHNIATESSKYRLPRDTPGNTNRHTSLSNVNTDVGLSKKAFNKTPKKVELPFSGLKSSKKEPVREQLEPVTARVSPKSRTSNGEETEIVGLLSNESPVSFNAVPSHFSSPKKKYDNKFPPKSGMRTSRDKRDPLYPCRPPCVLKISAKRLAEATSLTQKTAGNDSHRATGRPVSHVSLPSNKVEKSLHAPLSGPKVLSEDCELSQDFLLKRNTSFSETDRSSTLTDMKALDEQLDEKHCGISMRPCVSLPHVGTRKEKWNEYNHPLPCSQAPQLESNSQIVSRPMAHACGPPVRTKHNLSKLPTTNKPSQVTASHRINLQPNAENALAPQQSKKINLSTSPSVASCPQNTYTTRATSRVTKSTHQSSKIPQPNASPGTPMRRSARNRNAPTNYYAPAQGFSQRVGGHEPDSDEVQLATLKTPEPVTPPNEVAPVIARHNRCQQHFDDNDYSALLRSREFGYATHQNRVRIGRRLDDLAKWESWKSWMGASSDVLVLSWSPDSTRFAAGAAAQTDEHSMQYNRNNNLLLGNLSTSKIKELPDHRIKRPLMESGPNSHSTYVMVDPNLYMTVTATHWTSCGNRLYTASFDRTVKLWDVSSHDNSRCIKTLRHPGEVQEMAVSKFDSQLVATGCNSPSFLLWRVEDDNFSKPSHLPLPQDKCANMIPSSLQWGKMPRTSKYLVGGLTAEDPSNSQDPSRFGYLALWQVNEAAIMPLHVTPNAQNIFDVAWHPNCDVFATGSTVPFGARSYGIGTNVRSLVRIYDPLNGKKCVTQMYECTALDMNQVTFCPANENYITASCTDGVTYVWDHRNPNRVMHKLRHGEPIGYFNQALLREQADVGVRCSVWGKGFEFYTGASDGVVKRWDIRLAPENVLQENVASFNQEIMCASISPDYANMVLGDASGGVHVISTAPWGRSDENFPTFELERAPEPKTTTGDRELAEGIKEAAALISSGKLIADPVLGPLQGPKYDGPYASWARPENTAPEDMASTSLIPDIQATQLDGPPPNQRRGLDKQTRKRLEDLIHFSAIRNRKRGEHKRKRDVTQDPKLKRSAFFQSLNIMPRSCRVADTTEACKTTSAVNRLWKIFNSQSPSPTPRRASRGSFKVDPNNFIDLTLDSDDDSVQQISPLEEDSALEEDHWWPINVDPNLEP
ncbi:predicted protein [Uncinocarpus reesii 1704]|uniref:Uncharacterized protein n=1 Tax=Uncinocarpus reesii (strain UAMH 1704) TaxID=336963 RepID=C4JMM1_UNCRE|nr:uncharacterized protein UREG_04079 [Uncinocarpus reesii 1704]EEP79233.1 predicted protein [Uncinocarpus reesii 1704]